MTSAERRKAQNAFMLLSEKCDGPIKERQVCNGKHTREWLSREDAASPTILAAIDAKEKRDILTVDIPNTFIQTPMEYREGKEQVIMKITGVLVDI